MGKKRLKVGIQYRDLVWCKACQQMVEIGHRHKEKKRG